MKRRHQPHRPGVAAEDSQRHRLQPVQQRRLVKKRDAVRAGRQPIAALEHPATDFAVTTFIGNCQRPQCRQHQQHCPQTGHDQPRFLPLAQGWRRGRYRDRAQDAAPLTSPTCHCVRAAGNSGPLKYANSQPRAAPIGSDRSALRAGWHMMVAPAGEVCSQQLIRRA